MPALVSEDGRWWWDGHRWRTRLVEGPQDLLWFTATPEWFTRVLVMGLIGLIPIVGSIAILGWALAATDMVRQGWKELPPAGFQHLERGVNPFVVGLVYGVVLVFTALALVVVAVVIATSGRAGVALAILIALVVLLLLVAWWLYSLYVFAALLVVSDRLGMAKALDPRVLLKAARANEEISIRVGLTYLVALLVFFAVSVAVAFIIPFSGLLLSLGLPAIYALIVPSLAGFRVEPPERPAT